MIGKTIFELERVDSTNAYANQVLSKGELDEGTVIWAHEQFAGRGQQNHQWISESGKNLTFTVILKPGFLAPDQQFLINKAVSLGVLDFIRNSLNRFSSPKLNPAINSLNPADSCQFLGTSELVPADKSSIPVTSSPLQTDSSPIPVISIKWPNDIYLGNQKIGGILIEHKIMGLSMETSLAGIGVNINQTRFSSEIPNPVSLIHVLRSEMGLKEALLSVCRFLDLRYIALMHNNTDSLDHDYHKSLLGFNQWRNFTCDDAPLEGKIAGVDNLGRLLVETHSGEVLYFNHGEIEYLLSD